MFNYNKIQNDDSQKPELFIVEVANCDKLNLRASNSCESEILEILEKGTQLQVEEIVDGWALVYTSSGRSGYVMENFIKI